MLCVVIVEHAVPPMGNVKPDVPSHFHSVQCSEIDSIGEVLSCGIVQCKGWQDGLEVRTLTSKLSSLGFNHDRAINCHPGVLQVG